MSPAASPGSHPRPAFEDRVLAVADRQPDPAGALPGGGSIAVTRTAQLLQPLDVALHPRDCQELREVVGVDPRLQRAEVGKRPVENPQRLAGHHRRRRSPPIGWSAPRRQVELRARFHTAWYRPRPDHWVVAARATRHPSGATRLARPHGRRCLFAAAQRDAAIGCSGCPRPPDNFAPCAPAPADRAPEFRQAQAYLPVARHHGHQAARRQALALRAQAVTSACPVASGAPVTVRQPRQIKFESAVRPRKPYARAQAAAAGGHRLAAIEHARSMGRSAPRPRAAPSAWHHEGSVRRRSPAYPPQVTGPDKRRSASNANGASGQNARSSSCAGSSSNISAGARRDEVRRR